jgi:uncharacterized membrane protein
MIEIVWHPRRAHFTVALLSLSVFLYLLTTLPLPPALCAEWRVVADWLLWLGAVFAVITAVTGWLAYNSVDHDDVSHAAMTRHRNWALPTAAVFVLLALWRLWCRFTTRESATKASDGLFAASLAVGGILLASTAWHGAELVYRHGLGVMSLPNTGGGAGELLDGQAATPEAGTTRANKPPAKPVHDHSTHQH